MIRGQRAKLGLLVLLGALAGAAPAQAALSHDGTVIVRYSGKLAQAYVANPSNPAYQQGNVTLTWDETATFALSGRAEHDETSRLVSWNLTVSGGHHETAAPPNQAIDCTSSFSRRPGAENPISVFYNNGAVGVTAKMPVGGSFVQSSVADPSSHCYVQPNGGADYPPPGSTSLAYGHALLAEETVGLPSNPFSRTFAADGTGGEGDGSQVTQSLRAVLRVTTNGRTAPPPKPALTPAETQAKKDALQALKQTLPAAFYPCVTLAAGATLLAPTPLGLAVGGTLTAIGGKLCADYYHTILAEIDTVKDPPRSDFEALASTAPAVAATSPARRLLAAADATRSAAVAIATTLARETGARRAHNLAAAARQDRHLKKLSILFRRRRVAEIAAGRTLAAQLRASGSNPRLGAAQVRAAQSTLLAQLSSRGLTRGNARFVRGLLRRGALDVRSTLGR